MQILLKKYQLQLKHTFSISRESRNQQDTLIVCLSLNGKTGYGEATASKYYNITVESMILEIEKIKNHIETFNFTTPGNFHSFLTNKALSNFAICALDIAAHDMYGKLKNKPLHQIWNTQTNSYPITNYTIGIDSIPKMVEKIKEKPWPIYKIKLGTENDVAIVKELRKHTNAIFRIDANCAWTAEETIDNADMLKELDVEFIEQPLKATDWEGMKKVAQKSALPTIADESCIIETDVEKCASHFSGINIKLTKCGGLTPALRMIAKGKALGLKVMTGCMTESTVGISAIAQLLPQLDYVDMDGALLLKNDIAKGVVVKENGKIVFPKTPGTGVTLL